MRGHLGLAVARQNALAIAFHANDALERCEIGEIPQLLPNEPWPFIDFGVDARIIIALEFLAEYFAMRAMNALDGVGAITR